MRLILVFSVFVIIFWGCNSTIEDGAEPIAQIEAKPKPVSAAKTEFRDSVKQPERETVANGNQRAWYECSEPMDVDAGLFRVQKGKTYFSIHQGLGPTKLKKMGFYQLDNNPKGYFTAYLVNASDTTFSVRTQDGSLMMIQEALDEEGNWEPIEYWVHSGCGNSYYSLVLEPGKYALVPIKAYAGNFKTKLRLKMKVGDGIFYSKSFQGSIDKAQFQREDGQVNGILYHGNASYLED